MEILVERGAMRLVVSKTRAQVGRLAAETVADTLRAKPDARRSALLVAGEARRALLRRTMEGPVSAPNTALLLHRGGQVTVFAAADWLRSGEIATGAPGMMGA
ncbi:MAG TPA: hypothetical protein VF808_03425 [Ktedonobacterales bacterium]